MEAPRAALWHACRQIEEGKPRAALESLGGAAAVARAGPAERSVGLVALGMVTFAEGAAARAEHFFAQAFDIGLPLAASLRQCGRYFQRTGAHARAFECMALLQQLETGHYFAFWRSLPPAAQCRYAPLVLRTLFRGSATQLPLLLEFRRELERSQGVTATSLILEAWLAGAGTDGPLLREAETTLATSDGAPLRQALLESISPADSPLRRAGEHLAAGSVEAALAALGAHPSPQEPMARAIARVAQALLRIASKDTAGAAQEFRAAFELGVPLPALLQPIGRWALQEGEFAMALECYLLLQQAVPGALIEFWQALPPERQARYAPLRAAGMFHQPMPKLYALQTIKSALVVQYGAEAAALAYAGMVRIKGVRGARNMPVLSLADYAGPHALLQRELIAPREVSLEQPEFHGEAPRAPVAGRSRSVFFCVLPDLIATGKSNLLVAGDCVLMDFQGGERAAIPVNLDVDPALIAAPGEDAAVLEIAEDARCAPLATALPLLGVHSGNYGHWIFEHMFRLWALLDVPEFAGVPILIDRQMPAQSRECLEFFAGPEHPVVVLEPGESVRVERLWACSAIAYWPAGEKPDRDSAYTPESWCADTAALARLLRSLEPRLATAAPRASPARIFLARRPGQRRGLVNHDEVQAWFAGQGFVPVDFAEHSFVEQLRMIRAAQFVVGPDGSAFFNTLLAPAGLRIGMLSQPVLEGFEWFGQIFRDLGHHFLVLPGEVEREHAQFRDMGDYRIALDALPAFLTRLAAMR